MSFSRQSAALPACPQPLTPNMMDEIDFELCLNIDRVLSGPRWKQQEPGQTGQSNSINKAKTTRTARTRKHTEIEDTFTDEQSLEQLPPAKKGKISPCGRTPDMQVLPPNTQSLMDWTESIQSLDQNWESPSFRNPPHLPFETSIVHPGPDARAPSEETEVSYDMLYIRSESDTEMEMEAVPAPEGFYYGRYPLYPYGTWPLQSGSIVDEGWGSFTTSKQKADVPGFTIYEDPETLEIDGVVPSTDWFTSSEDDKENIEDGYEETFFLREIDTNVIIA